MLRLLLVLIGVVALGAGVKWRFIDAPLEERTVVTDAGALMTHADDGVELTPVKLDATLAEQTWFRTSLGRPHYARCKPDDVRRVDAPTGAPLEAGCPVEVRGELEPRAVAIELTTGDTLCERALLAPVAGHDTTLWVLRLRMRVSADSICKAGGPVRRGRPGAALAGTLSARAVDLSELKLLMGEGEWRSADVHRGNLSRVRDLAYNRGWGQVDTVERTMLAHVAQQTGGREALVAIPETKGLPSMHPPAVRRLAGSDEPIFVAIEPDVASPSTPLTGVARFFDLTVAATPDFAPTRTAVIELGRLDEHEGDRRSTANFAMIIGIVCFSLAGALHLVVKGLEWTRRQRRRG